MAQPWLVSLGEFAAAAALTVVIVRLLSPLAHRFDWLDRPRGRKNHATATPYTGGVAMFLAALLTLSVMPLASETLTAFGGGFAALLIVGALDDFYDLPWVLRLSVQLGACLLMVYLGGLRIEFIGPANAPGSIALGAFAVPFTVLITLGMINAMNMIDGIDGAAGCLGLAALILLAVVCIATGNDALRDRVVLFMGVMSGFLVMNLRHRWQARAQVFLGNSGSAVVGFGLAWLAVRASQTTSHACSTLFTPWFLALPLLDAGVVILRRLQRRNSPFHADHDHLHHLLLDAGYAPTRAALGMGAASLLLGIAALLAVHLGLPPVCQIAGFLLLLGLHFAFTHHRERAVGMLRRWNGSDGLPVAEAVAARTPN